MLLICQFVIWSSIFGQALLVSWPGPPLGRRVVPQAPHGEFLDLVSLLSSLGYKAKALNPKPGVMRDGR